ncbi:MAG: hypothetical protein LBI14_02335 [Treponema sp.]|jgi:hypothetical protein|nr:hypothetical protein [Treponema sp.]
MKIKLSREEPLERKGINLYKRLVSQLITTDIGMPAQWLIEAAASIGLDYSKLTHEITNHFKTHVIKRHGELTKHGAATVTEADFELIPSIVEKPDMAIIGATRRGIFCNVYIKIESNIAYLYFDQVLDSKRNRALRSGTFYKVTRPLTLDEVLKNVSRNDKTDISKAKILA